MRPRQNRLSAGVQAVLFYLTVYYLMNLGAFWVVMLIANATGREDLPSYRGLAWRGGALPALALAVFLFSLAGLPPLAGFVGKFYLFAAGVEGRLIALVVLGVLNSVVSVYYYLRLVVMMYMREGKTQASTASLPWPLGVALAVSLLGIFYLGLYPGPFVNLATLAASPLP